MGMSKCYSLMKCLLIIFNIIFLAVGVGAGAFAIWALWGGHGGGGAAARAALLAAGAWGGALAGGALAGLAGAARRSASLLAAAFALLALTAVAEGAAAWWAAAHGPQLRAALRAELARAVAIHYGDHAAHTQALDAIQIGLQCCGESGVRDWQSSAWGRARGEGGAGGGGAPLDLSVRAPPAYYWVPTSCCREPESAECARAVRVPAAAEGAGAGGAGAGAGGALRGAGCGERVVGALARAARAALGGAAALGAAHAAALLLTLALCLRTHPAHHYKG